MRSARWHLLSFLFVLGILLPAVAPVAAQQGDRHGIDPADMDLTVDPAQDFYRFANGGWLDRTEIPDQLLTLIDSLAQGNDLREGSDEWKAVQLFQQGVDTDARNANGSDPIAPTLAEIDAISTVEDLHAFLQESRFHGVSGLFTINVYSDLEDSNVCAAYLEGPQLWLPY